MTATQTLPDNYRISTGGLFYRLSLKSHLSEDGNYHIKRHIIFWISLAWLPLFILTVFDGTLLNSELTLPFLIDIKPHVRYLISLPLLIAAAVIIDPLVNTVIQNFANSGILDEKHRVEYFQMLDKLTARKDSTIADIVILVFTAVMIWVNIESIAGQYLQHNVTPWFLFKEAGEYHISLAGWWLLFISSPILQILMYRWIWRFFLWVGFLYQLSRFKLLLQPTHPDLTGGLGMLKDGQQAFIIIFVAFGSMLSVSIAEEILYTELTFAQARPIVFGYIIASIVITSLPLLFFTMQLIHAKRDGRRLYGTLGYKLSSTFDRKWGKNKREDTGDNLLTAMDPSALADYTAIFDTVRNMQIIPVHARNYLLQFAIIALPFVPLLFTEISVHEVFKRLLDTLI